MSDSINKATNNDCPECGKPRTMQISDRSGKGPTVPVCVPCTKKRMAAAFPGLLP